MMSSTTPRAREWRAVTRAIALVARSGRGWFVGTVVLMSLGGLGMAAVVLLGQLSITRLTRTDPPSTDRTTWLLLAGVMLLSSAIAFAQLAATGIHKLLAERVMYAWNERVLRTAGLSSMWEFELPEFHGSSQLRV